jgi:hypothetical protein
LTATHELVAHLLQQLPRIAIRERLPRLGRLLTR